ncbi:MAG: hypothetical protein AB1918_15505 [Pseudomonadota bacterium]
MKVKMLQARRAIPYGAAAEEFRKGEIYDLPDKLATSFLTEGVALPVRQQPQPAAEEAEPQAPRRKR